jgi:hypothetical protein
LVGLGVRVGVAVEVGVAVAVGSGVEVLVGWKRERWAVGCKVGRGSSRELTNLGPITKITIVPMMMIMREERIKVGQLIMRFSFKTNYRLLNRIGTAYSPLSEPVKCSYKRSRLAWCKSETNPLRGIRDLPQLSMVTFSRAEVGLPFSMTFWTAFSIFFR